MPREIELKDCNIETVLDADDFEYLIDRYMGFDAVKFFREMLFDLEKEHGEQVNELYDEIHDLKIDIENLRKELKYEQQKNREQI